MQKFSWGSDCVYVEEAYGALLQARRLVADALLAKITRANRGWTGADGADSTRFHRYVHSQRPLFFADSGESQLVLARACIRANSVFSGNWPRGRGTHWRICIACGAIANLRLDKSP